MFLTATEARMIPYTFSFLSNKEIAQEMKISVSSVKHHIGSILKKFNARSRQQLLYRLGHFEVSVKWIPREDGYEKINDPVPLHGPRVLGLPRKRTA
jgi:DNA-binding CsgD family transcriptional regulator